MRPELLLLFKTFSRVFLGNQIPMWTQQKHYQLFQHLQNGMPMMATQAFAMQLEETISTVLGDYLEAQHIARECLHHSKRFALELC